MIRDLALALKYAKRDLRAGLKGFYIFITCIFLSVAIISAVQSLSLGMKESLRNDGRYILGGDLSLKTLYKAATREQMDYLRRNFGPTTVTIETRSMARNMDSSQSSLVELKGVDPFYPLYGAIHVKDENGKTNIYESDVQNMLVPPRANQNKWGALVEKELLSRLNVEIGDWIQIGKQKFRIKGVLENEPDRIAGRAFTIAPRVMISNYVFHQTGLTATGSQVEYNHKIMMPKIKTIADIKNAQKQIEGKYPNANWKGKSFLNAAPRAERTINRMTLFLTFTGLTTLIIAAIGIANAVRAFLDDKMADIATLKCLGATRKTVLKIYLLEMLVLATLGVLLGLGFGILTSKIAAHFLTARLAISNTAGIYPFALLVSAALGYLITIAASLWPIGKAIKTSPANLFRDLISPITGKPSFNIIITILITVQLIALTTFTLTNDNRFMAGFLVGTVGVFVLFYLCSILIKWSIKKMHISSNPELRLSLTNLYRPGNITTSIILSIGLGLTVLIAVALVQNNFVRLLTDDIAEDAPSFFFLDIQSNQMDKFKEVIAKYKSARDLKITPSYRGRIVSVNGVPAEEALVDKREKWIIGSDRGFTYTAELPTNSKIIEGEWWDNNYKGEPIVSIATNVKRAFNIGVGDKLTVKIMGVDTTATVANVREISWGSFTMNFATTFAPGAIDNIPSSNIATVIVDKEEIEPLQNELARTLPNVTSVKVGDALALAKTILTSVTQAISISALVTLAAGVLVLSGGIAAARKRHLYEAIVFKVLGATRKKIIKTFVLEYALLGIITVILSAVLGTITSYWVQSFMRNVTWEFSWQALSSITIIAMIITLAAGLFGTLSALKQKAAPYLRNE